MTKEKRQMSNDEIRALFDKWGWCTPHAEPLPGRIGDRLSGLVSAFRKAFDSRDDMRARHALEELDSLRLSLEAWSMLSNEENFARRFFADKEPVH